MHGKAIKVGKMGVSLHSSLRIQKSLHSGAQCKSRINAAVRFSPGKGLPEAEVAKSLLKGLKRSAGGRPGIPLVVPQHL